MVSIFLNFIRPSLDLMPLFCLPSARFAHLFDFMGTWCTMKLKRTGRGAEAEIVSHGGGEDWGRGWRAAGSLQQEKAQEMRWGGGVRTKTDARHRAWLLWLGQLWGIWFLDGLSGLLCWAGDVLFFLNSFYLLYLTSYESVKNLFMVGHIYVDMDSY